MKVRFNWKLFLFFTVVSTGLACGTYYLYELRKADFSTIYLERAEKLKKEGKTQQATEVLFQHTKMYPNDAVGWYELATSYAANAQTADAKLRAIDIARSALEVVKDATLTQKLTSSQSRPVMNRATR